MKHIVIFLIRTYQRILSPTLKLLLGIHSFCRYSPTCSVYTIEAIKKKGVVLGISSGIARVLTCHPGTVLARKVEAA